VEIVVRVAEDLSFVDPDPPDGVEPPRGGRVLRRIVERLLRATTHINPSYVRARQQGRRADPRTDTVRLLRRDDGRISIPRGYLSELRAAVAAEKIPIVWDIQVRSNESGPMSIEQVGGDRLTLREEYQPRLVRSILDRRQGVVVLPCGGGKTISGAAAIKASGEAALVLVHTEDLLDQWVSAIRFVFGVGMAPRVVGGGNHDPRPLAPGEVCIGMVQTIQRNLEGYREMVASAGFLLVDEAHRSPADLFADVIRASPARYRIGLSATPERADGFGFLLGALIGPIIFSMSALELIDLGYLRRPLIVPVLTNYTPSPATREWMITCPDCAESKSARRKKRAEQTIASRADKLALRRGVLHCKRKGRRSVSCRHVFPKDQQISLGATIQAQVTTECMSDLARVDLMVDLVVAGVEVGRLALTLATRKPAVREITQGQISRGVRARGLTSATARGDRQGAIARFRAREYQSMVATQLADEGLDVPALDLMVIGSDGAHSGTAQQRAGRCSRPTGHEVPVVLDLVDRYPGSRRRWLRRAAAYREAYGPECLPVDRPVSTDLAMAVVRALDSGDRAIAEGLLSRS